MKMKECCKNCVYKHHLHYIEFEPKPVWCRRYICTMLIETDGGEDAFAIYVNDNDRCEVFTARSDIDEREMDKELP